MLIMVLKNTSPFALIHFGLKFAGLTSTKGRPWSVIYCVFHVALVALYGVFGVLEIILQSEGVTELILAISTLSVFIQVIVKQVIIISNEKELLDFISRLAKYRSELLEDEDNRSQLTVADSICWKYAIRFNSAMLSFPLVSFISNFYTAYSSKFENPILIHKVWIPWNINELWRYLAATMIVLLMTMSLVIIYASFATVQFVFTFQMSTYLKILRRRLEIKGAGDKAVYYHHGVVIRFLQDYNKLFAAQLYTDVLLGSLEPCGFGYAMMKGLKTFDASAVDFLIKFVLALIGTFILCRCGQEISTQMENLHESAYMNNWYEEKPAIRRDLYTMMGVTTRPMTVNFRLFTAFDFKCYAGVVQGIYSYLMMVSSLDNSD